MLMMKQLMLLELGMMTMMMMMMMRVMMTRMMRMMRMLMLLKMMRKAPSREMQAFESDLKLMLEGRRMLDHHTSFVAPASFYSQ